MRGENTAETGTYSSLWTAARRYHKVCSRGAALRLAIIKHIKLSLQRETHCVGADLVMQHPWPWWTKAWGKQRGGGSLPALLTATLTELSSAVISGLPNSSLFSRKPGKEWRKHTRKILDNLLFSSPQCCTLQGKGLGHSSPGCDFKSMGARSKFCHWVQNIPEKLLMKFVPTILPRCGLVTEHCNISTNYKNSKVSTSLDQICEPAWLRFDPLNSCKPMTSLNSIFLSHWQCYLEVLQMNWGTAMVMTILSVSLLNCSAPCQKKKTLLASPARGNHVQEPHTWHCQIPAMCKETFPLGSSGLIALLIIPFH